MTIAFTDRRCTVDVHPTAKGYSFEYGNKTNLRPNEETVHQFFLKEYQANKLDTVKLRFEDKSYYLHLVDGPEKCTKRQLRSILARECDGGWCEEKNGKQRFFVREGWLFPKVKELTQKEFAAYRPTSTIQKAMKFAMGALSLAPILPSHASHVTGLGALLFSLLNASPAVAQMPAIGEFRINTNTMYGHYPAIAALKDGSFVVVWSDGQTDIYGQRYNITGTPMDSEFPINTNTTNYQGNSAIAALNDGGFVVAWNGAQTGDYDIYGRIYNATGIPVGSEFRINTNTTDYQRLPTVVALKDGGFVAAWQGRQTGYDDIYGQRYNATGMPMGIEFQINTNTAFIQNSPAIAALNDGSFVAAWHGSQTGDYDIYGQRYDAAGVPLGSEFRINTNTTSWQLNPAIAALNDGGFVAAWQGGETGDYDIYGQRYDAAGVSRGSEFRINTNTTNYQQFPTVAVLNDGGFVVAWRGGGLQIGNGDIYGQRYDAAGLPIGSEFRMNTDTTSDQDNAAIAALQDGGFVVAWHGSQTGTYEIYGQRYEANGMPVPIANPSSSSIGTSQAESSSVQTSQATPGFTSTPATTSPSMLPTSTSQLGSSSVQTSQATSGFTSTSAANSPSMLPASTSQVGSSSSSRTVSSQSSMISSSIQSLAIPSITEITYGTDYSIDIDGVNVGTFTITGGTGLYDGTQSNTLTLQLDPDADLVGQTIALFTLPSGEEGNFQTIEIQGVSCLAYDTQIVQDGGSRFFQASIQATTCSTSSKPTLTFMLRV